MQVPVSEDQNIGKVVCHLKAHVFVPYILHWLWSMLWVHSALKTGKSIRGTDIYDCQDQLQSTLFATPPTTTATKSTKLEFVSSPSKEIKEWVIQLQVTTTDPGSDNKLIGREDRLALSSHRGRGGFLAGGPMECGPRDLVQVWAWAILYFIVFASLLHQKRKTAMS